MKLEDVFTEWAKDVEIDRTELGEESLKTARLHSKYIQALVKERLQLRKLEADMKSLKLEKYEFYTQGPTEETRDKGWTLPAKGLILKSDLPMYIEGDPDIIKMSLKIGCQQEKVELLESIVKSVMNRGFALKAAIEWARFQAGG